MPRPKILRRIRFHPEVTYYKPRGIPLRLLEEIELASDEIEAIRLADYENMNQVEAAEKMRISQSTFQRILASAHGKIADALIKGKAIKINLQNNNDA